MLEATPTYEIGRTSSLPLALLKKGELLVRLSDTVGRAIQIISDQTAESLLKERRIQGFDTTVARAIIDSVVHFRGHGQEIISLTRQQLQNRYEFYFVPKTPEQGGVAWNRMHCQGQDCTIDPRFKTVLNRRVSH